MSDFKNNFFFNVLWDTNIPTIDEITKECNSFFSNYREIGAVYLCGSYAKNSATPYSDIDLLIFFNKGIKYKCSLRGVSSIKCDWWGKENILSIKLNKPIDLFDGDFLIYNDNHILEISYNLIKDSKLVYQKKGFIIPDLDSLERDYLQFRITISK